MNADQYCQQKSMQSGSSFYYSFLFLPAEQRKAIQALYAFCRVVDDIVDDCTEPAVAAQKLAWWHDEIDRVFLEKPEHPIGVALLKAKNRFDLQRPLFKEILQGMQMDLHHHAYETFDDLRLYCHCVASATGVLSAQIFGFSDPQTIEYAKKLGIAFQLVNIIRDVGEDAKRGRIYLPHQELEQFGVKTTDIFKTHYSDAFKQLMIFQTQRARNYYTQALALLPSVDRQPQSAGLMMGAIYFTLLDEIEKSDFQVLHQKICLTPLRKLWVAWKTARRLKKNA
jgi:phytoene synthase